MKKLWIAGTLAVLLVLIVGFVFVTPLYLSPNTSQSNSPSSIVNPTISPSFFGNVNDVPSELKILPMSQLI